MVKISDIKKHFLMDKELEADGVEKQYPGSEIRVTVRRSNQAVYKKALRKEYRKFKQLGNDMPPEIELKIKMTAGARALVTGWNIEDLPCEFDNILKLFEEMPDFYYWVEAEADNIENYRKEEVAEDKGPLSNTSDGSTDGETKTS